MTSASKNYSISQIGNIITTDANGAITAMNTSSYTSNLGPVGNVTITGGSNGQALTTNGSGTLNWSTVSTDNAANANYANYQGTVTGSSQSNITSVGTLTGLTSNGTINFTGASNVSLGAVGNVKITGGSNGQYLQTNGSGGLSWATVSSGGTSDWVSAPVTITATTTNPTKGTTAFDYIRYRKLADKYYRVQVSYRQTSTGTAGNGIYLYTLPGGLQFDASQYKDTNSNSGVVSTGAAWSAVIPGGTGLIYVPGSVAIMIPYAYDATRFYLVAAGGYAGYGGLQRHDAYNLQTSEIYIDVEFPLTATT